MSTIVMCADHGGPDNIFVDGATVIMAKELCWRPGQLKGLVPPGETSLLLALHNSDAEMGRVQATVRRMGFDALGVGVLDLERLDGADAVSGALTALKARTEAYPGASPEQVRLVPRPARSSRRSLFSLGIPTYTGAPMIDVAHCVAPDGCRACVNECPAEALAFDGGAVAYDKAACIGCGICITTCPTGAVVNPVATPKAIEAEIRAAVAATTEPVGIRFVCGSGRRVFEPGWHDVEVPCTGMLTVGWLLAALMVGASAVTSITCADSGCELGLSSRTTATLIDAAEILAAFGFDTARLDGRSPDHPALMMTPSVSDTFGAMTTQRVIGALHDASHVDPGFVTLERADIGSIEIDGGSCTACEMCAKICPSDALGSWHDRDGVRIDFDPRQCVACGQCVAVCPEIDRDAITLASGFDPADWNRGRRELRHDATATCELCGNPVAPAAMLDRISAILGDEHSGTIAVIGKRCIDCRGR